jgi:hypothetical protein
MAIGHRLDGRRRRRHLRQLSGVHRPEPREQPLRVDWGSPLPTHVQDTAQWRHLVADAQLAEEVAVRSGDAEYPRRYWPGAGDLHERNAKAQVACLARLNAVIEDLHGVTSLQRSLANQERNALFDSLVVLSFLPIYVFGIRRVCERFGSVLRADAPSVRVSAVAIGSIIYSGVGLVAFRPWFGSMEGMRVGNPDGDFGFRAAAENYWSLAFVASWLTIGAILFWFVAFAFRRVEDSRSSADDTTRPT